MSSSTYALLASYNILNPYHAVKWAEQRGLNETGKTLSRDELKASTGAQDANAWRQFSNWSFRCDAVSDNIQFAHIACLQEVSVETIEKLRQLTGPKGYQLASAVYHASSQPMQQFGNAILYKAGKVHLKQAFEIVHRAGETRRSAACGIFQIDDKIVAIASVHLAGYNSKETNLEKKQESKKSGFNELKTYVEELEKHAEGLDGIIISGDFNEDPSEALFDLYRPGFLKSHGFQCDDNLAATEPSTGRRIDWIFYKSLALRKTVQLTSMGLESIQKQASDHLITGTVIEWV